MNPTLLARYAKLLVHYCMELTAGEKLLIQTTTLALPLVQAIYEECQQNGIICDAIIEWEGKSVAFAKYGHANQAAYVSPLYETAIATFDGYLVIRAPFNLTVPPLHDAHLSNISATAQKASHQLYFERTATRDLKRNLCQYPTIYGAELAGMTLEEYTEFIVHACFLNESDPAEKWLAVRKQQQRIVDRLNDATHIRYQSPVMDISFDTTGRTWINSDGKTNMPSGEVYTSPVEDSVNGYITFTLPSVYQGKLIDNVRLEVTDGYITGWSADNHIELLDQVFAIPGTRRFGEAAIGTNQRIQQITKNILFDEKIGGTVHMAIGQSYLQAGGKNESSVHWDMITDMTQGGKIFADGKLIYENGEFIF